MSEIKPKKRINKWLLLSFGVLVSTSLAVVLLWKKIPPEIPWFYSLPWGENQLMPKIGLLVVLGCTIVIGYLGSFLSRWTKKEDKIVEEAVSVSLFFICTILVTNMIRVLLIFI